jgi:hypothetical protein
MTELQQRALAVALREHQEEQRKDKQAGCPYCPFGPIGTTQTCPWCGRNDAEQAKKDAGDERLLCAVLYEGKGEPN